MQCFRRYPGKIEDSPAARAPRHFRHGRADLARSPDKSNDGNLFLNQHARIYLHCNARRSRDAGLQRLSEYAISLVWSCARFHGQGVDRLVVLQGPPHLQILIFPFLPHDLVYVVEGQHGDSQLSVLLLDPEHQQPQSVDLPAIEERLQQTQQADPSVETLEQWVDVGEDYTDRRWFVLIIDEESQVGIREAHHALLNVSHLLIAQGDDCLLYTSDAADE